MVDDPFRVENNADYDYEASIVILIAYGKLFKAITVNILAILLKWDKARTPF